MKLSIKHSKEIFYGSGNLELTTYRVKEYRILLNMLTAEVLNM